MNAQVRSGVSDAVPMVPRDWDIGPTIPMGPSPWPSWNARPHGHLHEGRPLYIHTYIHTSSVKGHRTRVEREIGNLLHLLKDQYSATSEDRINDRLEKLEKHTHRLSDIAEYLVSLKYNKARDHREDGFRVSSKASIFFCFFGVFPPSRRSILHAIKPAHTGDPSVTRPAERVLARPIRQLHARYRRVTVNCVNCYCEGCQPIHQAHLY